ncbi:Methionyl-tRNA formyltransferase, partial [Ascosphaera atra]
MHRAFLSHLRSRCHGIRPHCQSLSLNPSRALTNTPFTYAATRYSSTTKHIDPLRILFCGSDQFSIYALQALYNEKHRDSPPTPIEAIDVVCRPPKRVGAKLKKVREVPIKGVARELGLPVHEIDTFTGWSPPNPINLIIAVSFGLLVPKRLLFGAKYGGLNLHPSLLPDLRGPAPLHHTILHGDTHTGVTLQTLHPSRFDHGLILDQQPLEIPSPEQCDLQALTDLVSTKGADMLARAVRERVFVPPLTPVATQEVEVDGDDEEGGKGKLRHAPKVQKEDMHVDWKSWDWKVISRRYRALGSAWSVAAARPQARKDGTTGSAEAQMQRLRVIFPLLRPVDEKNQTVLRETLDDLGVEDSDVPPGVPFALVRGGGSGSTLPDGTQPIFVKTVAGEYLQADEIKVEGTKVAPACRAA